MLNSGVKTALADDHGHLGTLAPHQITVVMKFEGRAGTATLEVSSSGVAPAGLNITGNLDISASNVTPQPPNPAIQPATSAWPRAWDARGP